jgi:hypothetical protein
MKASPRPPEADGMEQQPFESQLDFDRMGPMGKANVAPYRRPPSRNVSHGYVAIEIAVFSRAAFARFHLARSRSAVCKRRPSGRPFF